MQEVRCSSHRATILKSPRNAGFFFLSENSWLAHVKAFAAIPLTVRLLSHTTQYNIVCAREKKYARSEEILSPSAESKEEFIYGR